MKGKNSKEVATEKLKPFEVMDAQGFDSGTFVFPATEQPEIPYIVLLSRADYGLGISKLDDTWTAVIHAACRVAEHVWIQLERYPTGFCCCGNFGSPTDARVYDEWLNHVTPNGHQ